MASALVITPQIEEDARKLAEVMGATPTEALASALQAKLTNVGSKHETARPSLEVMRDYVRQHRLTRLNDLSEDQLLGYDENGVPEQPYLDHR